MILKPDKRQGTVLINKNVYYNLLEQLFFNKLKLEVINDGNVSTV